MTNIIRVPNIKLIAATIVLLVLSSCVAHAQPRLAIDYNDARRILQIDDVSTVINHTTNYWARISDAQIHQINEYRKVARRHRSKPIEVITINSTNAGYFFDLLNLLQTELEDAGVKPTLGHIYAYYKLGDQFKTLNYDVNALPEPLSGKVKTINYGGKTSLPSGPPPIPGVSVEKNPIIAPERSDTVVYDHPTEAYRWTTRPPEVQSTNTLPVGVYQGIVAPNATLEEKLTAVASYTSGQILKVDVSSGDLKIKVDPAALESYVNLVTLYGRSLPEPRLIGEQDTLGISMEGGSAYLYEDAFDAFYTMVYAKTNDIDPLDPRYPREIYFYFNTPEDKVYAMDVVYRNLYNSLIEIYGGQYGITVDRGIGVGYFVGDRTVFTLESSYVDKFLKMNERRLKCALPVITSTTTTITHANSTYDIGNPTTYADIKPAPYIPESSLDPAFGSIYSE